MSIKAMKMALDALEPDTWESKFVQQGKRTAAREALRQAIEQAEKQEALILDRGCYERGCVAYDERDGDAVNMSQERVDETAKCKHEPWQSVQCTCGGTIYFKHTKREWVGLTDEEIYDYADKFLYSHGSNYGIKSFGKAIEAKLKEKNG